MNCQNFEIIVNELARQQMMEANVRDLALQHTDDCEACAEKLADERALTQTLRALAGEMAEIEAPPRIEGELLAAFRRNKFTQPARSKSYAVRYWATAAAAVLLLVIGIAAMSMRSRPSEVAAENPYIPPFQPKAAANTSAAMGTPVSVDPTLSTPSIEQGTVAIRTTKPHTRSSFAEPGSTSGQSGSPLTADSASTVAANYGSNEIATDFMPIGYSSPMNLEDGGQVMRVEVPRSTLAGFGLPVNMDRVNERVKADVLVGPDGQARAIRFVQ
jgi:hypothetical protein